MMIKKKFDRIPKLKDYPSRKEWEGAVWQIILKSEELLQLLITENERQDLVMRAAAAAGIASGKSYRKIGDELWLSPQTISVIKKALNEKVYKSYAERSKKECKKKVWSPNKNSEPRKSRPLGIPRRTKYGRIYI